MAIPVWVPGQILTSSDVNQWLAPNASFKTSDQTVTSSTALVNDTALVVPVLANAIYEVKCLVIYTALNGGDLKWTWTVPAGAALLYQALHNEGGATGLGNSSLVNSQALVGFAVGQGAGTNTGVGMQGSIVVGSTPGNLQLQWAQNTSSATSTTVRTGSYISLQRMS